MNKKRFKDFSEIKKETNTFVKDYREHFVQVVLTKYKIPYYTELSKKEKVALFDKHNITIVKDEKSKKDIVYRGDKIIGEWNQEYDLFFKNNQLFCELKFKVN